MGGGSLMIHLTVSHFGPIILSEVQGRMDSRGYINLLSLNVFPELDQHTTRSFWQWQQDNASIHCSNLAKEFFESEHISVIDWPVRRPDLNLVENIFSYLVKLIYAKNKQFNNKMNFGISFRRLF